MATTSPRETVNSSFLGEGIIWTSIDAAANWARSNSLWPMPFATACCGIELMSTSASRHDLSRFGSEVMRFTPRQCDLMIVAGRVVMKMLPVMQRIWCRCPNPNGASRWALVLAPVVSLIPMRLCKASIVSFRWMSIFRLPTTPRATHSRHSGLARQDQEHRHTDRGRVLQASRTGRPTALRTRRIDSHARTQSDQAVRHYLRSQTLNLLSAFFCQIKQKIGGQKMIPFHGYRSFSSNCPAANATLRTSQAFRF